MSAPEDTSGRGPSDHLLGILTEGQSSYIEVMEAEGQAQVVNSDVLPIEMNGGKRGDYEALGFVFGDVVDDLFQAVTLPGGWRREGSDHSMWSYVVDAEGSRRVAVFYKAAFYDRRAFMRIESS